MSDIRGQLQDQNGNTLHIHNAPRRLTLTRTSNAFVNNDDFNRLHAFETDDFLYFYGNLRISTGGSFPNATPIEIGKITGWSAIDSIIVTLPGQDRPTQTLLAEITPAGVIKIYSGQTITGNQFFRFLACVPKW